MARDATLFIDDLSCRHRSAVVRKPLTVRTDIGIGRPDILRGGWPAESEPLRILSLMTKRPSRYRDSRRNERGQCDSPPESHRQRPVSKNTRPSDSTFQLRMSLW